MRIRGSVSLFLALFVLAAMPLRAQFIEDALRMASPPDAVSARSAALGNAFIGVADDFSALYWNPAGLGQLRASEFALGLSNLSVSTDASFLGTTRSASEGSLHLNSIGMALPFPVARGSLVFAGGFQRLVNFAGASSYGGYNRNSSILTSQFDNEIDYDLSYNLNLQDTTLYNPTHLGFPIRSNVQQDAEIFESGNLGMWSFGGSSEVAPNAFVGLSLNILSGSYLWERTFIETDPSGVHRGTVIIGPQYDATGFEKLTVEENLDQTISGWNAKLGFLYKVKDVARVGVAVQTPTMVTVSETYMKSGRSDFRDDQGPYFYRYSLPTMSSEYDVTTPWVISVGASVRPVDFINISADAELTDFTQLEFDNTTTPALLDLNKNIRRELRQTTNFRAGVEVKVPQTDLFVRGGFRYQFSPYEADKDQSEYNVTTISAGLGYMFDNSLLLNLTFVQSTVKSFQYAYLPPESQITGENIPKNSYTYDTDLSRTWLMMAVHYLF
jgi:long-subunit fatty acid transport protein